MHISEHSTQEYKKKEMSKKHRIYDYVEIKADKNLVILSSSFIQNFPVGLLSLKLHITKILFMIKHHIKILKQSILQAYWRSRSSQRWASIKML
jgi:hypothetical protein